MYGLAVSPSGTWVAVGPILSGGNFYPAYSTSSNGTTWTAPAIMNNTSVPGYCQTVAVNSSGLFVMVGQIGGTNAPMYATSIDGSTWTNPIPVNSGTFYSMFGIYSNSTNTFVAFGQDASGNASTFLSRTV